MKPCYSLLCSLYMFISLQGTVPPGYYYPHTYTPHHYAPYPPYPQLPYICQHHDLYNKKNSIAQPSNGNNYEHFSSVISALLLGAGSGYLCKSCEPLASSQCFVLHVLYLTLWGACENSFMDIWVADLAAHDIKHNPSLMRQIAWVMSWISYLI